MAKKSAPAKVNPTDNNIAGTTPVRNSPFPKAVSSPPSTPATRPAATAARPALTHDTIARRAYEISQKSGGSEIDNWLQAERELRNGRS